MITTMSLGPMPRDALQGLVRVASSRCRHCGDEGCIENSSGQLVRGCCREGGAEHVRATWVPHDALERKLRAFAECQRYITTIREALGREPDSGDCRLRIKTHRHDLGTEYSVELVYDDEDLAAAAYAYRVEVERPCWGST